MIKHNALQLRFDWYKDASYAWKPCATEAVKDFILWLYGEGGEIACDKLANHGRRENEKTKIL